MRRNGIRRVGGELGLRVEHPLSARDDTLRRARVAVASLAAVRDEMTPSC